MIPIVPIPTNYTTPSFRCCATEFSKFLPNITQLLEGIPDSDSQKKPIGACATKDYLGPCAQCCVSSTSDAINYF